MTIGPLHTLPNRPACRDARCGFTVVEVIVAMTLLVSGALAVVGATAAAVRAVGVAETQLLAMSLAQRRLEMLAAAGCPAAVAGNSVDSATGVRERWDVTHSRNGLRLAVDSVEYVDHGDPRLVVRRRTIVC